MHIPHFAELDFEPNPIDAPGLWLDADPDIWEEDADLAPEALAWDRHGADRSGGLPGWAALASGEEAEAPGARAGAALRDGWGL